MTHTEVKHRRHIGGGILDFFFFNIIILIQLKSLFLNLKRLHKDKK